MNSDTTESTIEATRTIPRAFARRRLHSLMGLWLSIYIIIHLFTNSQAALFIGDDGQGFIRAVNAIQEMPYLPLIEIAILAVPILIHMIWGIHYAMNAKYNSFGKTGHTPYLPEYSRNHAYTWQRITAWILVFGLVAHIVHMRFIEHPVGAFKGTQQYYMMRVTSDPGLYTLGQRLGVDIYDEDKILAAKNALLKASSEADHSSIEKQKHHEEVYFVAALEKRPLSKGDVIAVANNFGTAELLMLRDTFKMPIMLALYTLFVLTACFHAFNGVWSFMFKWGITLSERSQRVMRGITTVLMVGVTALGLSAIWLTYWINLKQ